MIKILHIVNFSNNIGGIEQVVMNLYRNINTREVQFYFLSQNDDIPFREEIERMGGKVYKYPSELKHPIKCFKYLKKMKSSIKFNYIHIHKNSLANSLIILYFSILGYSNIILHSHNTNPTGKFKKIKSILHYINRPIINRIVDFNMTCSNAAAKWMFTKHNVSKVIYINNGINTKLFSFNECYRNEIRNKYKITNNTYLLGHVGRFDEEKNHKFLLQILKMCIENNLNCVLMLIGNGKLKTEIKNLATALDIDQNIVFVNTTSQVYKFYNAFDCFLLPSYHEGFPLVGVEAQINSLPCIFSNKVTEEIKISSCSFFLSIDHSANEWFKLIKQKLILNKRIHSLQQDKIQKYDIKSITKQVEDFYTEHNNEKISS